MLHGSSYEGMRFSTSDDLDNQLNGTPRTFRKIDSASAEDEAFFLGLRLNRGIDLRAIAEACGEPAIVKRAPILDALTELGLLEPAGQNIRLTDRGRLLSNEVFERLMLSDPATDPALPAQAPLTILPTRGPA